MNLVSLILAALFTAPTAIFALACQNVRPGRTPVIYFGGNKATQEQTQSWAGATQASTYGSQFAFEGNDLHGARSNQADVLRLTDADIRSCVDKINAPGFKGPIVLVGHSDGGWVINEIVARTNPATRGKIKFVSLDGYAAAGPDFDKVDVQCWTTYMAEKQATPPANCEGIAKNARSLYTHEMAKCKSCAFSAERGCSSNWCLHFRLINRNVPPTIGSANYDRVGYREVDPPLSFLDRFTKAGRATRPNSKSTPDSAR